MEPIDVDKIPSLTDSQLFSIMKEYKLNVGPITSTTRKLYEKKLISHLQTIGNSTKPIENTNDQVTTAIDQNTKKKDVNLIGSETNKSSQKPIENPITNEAKDDKARNTKTKKPTTIIDDSNDSIINDLKSIPSKSINQDNPNLDKKSQSKLIDLNENQKFIPNTASNSQIDENSKRLNPTVALVRLPSTPLKSNTIKNEEQNKKQSEQSGIKFDYEPSRSAFGNISYSSTILNATSMTPETDKFANRLNTYGLLKQPYSYSVGAKKVQKESLRDRSPIRFSGFGKTDKPHEPSLNTVEPSNLPNDQVNNAPNLETGKNEFNYRSFIVIAIVTIILYIAFVYVQSLFVDDYDDF